MTEKVIAVEGLTKVFKDFWGRTRRVAVRDLSFDLQKGEVLGLIGPNGAGKTTTIKTMLGLLRPTRGKLSILGGRPRDPKVKARLGFLPEESYLYRFLTPRETLMFFGKLFSLNRSELQSRIPKLLDRVGLGDVADKPIKEFSKGMARRLGLAQAMINEPELLLLDEPTSGLDPIGTREVKDLIIEQKEQGRSVLVCSHLLADMEGVCDRIAMLVGGQLKLYDTVDRLLAEPDRIQLSIKDPGDDVAAQWVEELRERGATELKVTKPHRSLEQLFIRAIEESQGTDR